MRAAGENSRYFLFSQCDLFKYLSLADKTNSSVLVDDRKLWCFVKKDRKNEDFT